MKDSVAWRLAELERRLDNVVRYGTVTAADYAAARVRVRSGDLETGWIPWLTRRASHDADWWAPEVGEQVVILSPCGDPGQATAVPAIYQSAHPAPDSVETRRRVAFGDGTVVVYDRAAKLLSIQCAGDIDITAAGNITITATGNFTVAAARIDLN